MSVKLISMVWDRYPVGGGEMHLALKLADHAHDDGTHVFPGVKTLAEKTRQSERTVFRQLQKMVASGWLIPVKNGGGGRGVFVEYRINPAWIKGDTSSGFAVKETLTSEAQNPDIHEKNPDKSCTPILGNRQEPSLNQSPLPPTGGEDVLEADFRKVVEAYPRRTNASVAKAREVWRTLRPNADLVLTMLAAIESQARSDEWQRNRGQFVPKLARWLTEQRWLDTHVDAQVRGGQALQGVGAILSPEPLRAPRPAAVPPPPEVRAKIANILASSRRGRSNESRAPA